MSTFLWSRGEPATDWSLLDQFGRESSALLRLWRGFMTARCFVAVVLLLLQAVTFALGQPLEPAAIALSVGYLGRPCWRHAMRSSSCRCAASAPPGFRPSAST